MTAIEILNSRGLTVTLAGARVRVYPGDRITKVDREFIILHRLEMVAELAAGDGRERRMSWQVVREGKPIATIAGGPMTLEEALLSAQFRWPDAEIKNFGS